LHNLIKVGNQEIIAKEFKGQRVITFKDIDLVHERPEGTAGRNFRENKERFIEGEDYFSLSSEDLKDFKQATNFVGSNAKEVMLITEQGYLMLVKSFTDDLAWDVQRQLVNTYFKVSKPLSQEQIMRTQLNMIDNVSDRVMKLENNMTIDYGQAQDLKQLGAVRIVDFLGGKKSLAYKPLSKTVFAELWHDYKEFFHINSYSNTPVVRYRESLDYVANWKPSVNTMLKIREANAQMSFA